MVQDDNVAQPTAGRSGVLKPGLGLLVKDVLFVRIV
jgi:hypothetical protein